MDINNKDPMFLRQIIMDHYSNPTKKGLLKKENMLYVHQISSSCVDNIHLELEIKDNKIINARFDGIGCAISTSSTDIIANQLENQMLSVTKEIIYNYFNMLFDKPYNNEKLNELIAFINISKQNNRIKCAMIGAKGFLELIDDYQNNKKN